MKTWSSLEKTLFRAFLLWVAAGLVFTLLRVSAVQVEGWHAPEWLRDFVSLCLRTGDPILILLAFANTHLLAAHSWGPVLARRWALIVVLVSLLIETVGARTGFPFGSYSYTNRFGPAFGVVPLTIPLAWHMVLTNALLLVRSLRPHLPRLGEAAAVGLLCTLYDSILEPFATTIKDYWQWKDSTVPFQNYVAWFVLATLLTWLAAPTAASRRSRDIRPAAILGVTTLLFVAGRWL